MADSEVRASSTSDSGSANLAEWLAAHASQQPDAPAVKQGDTVFSYAGLDDASARVAGLLAARGVGPGDHVGLIMPNVCYFPMIYYAILRLGAVVVPTNPLLKAGEIGYVWHDSACGLAFVFSSFTAEANKAAKDAGTDVVEVAPGAFDELLASQVADARVAVRRPDDTAVILYTSGTTGRPKGAELSHANIGTNAITSVETLFRGGPQDVIFGGLPLFHTFGQTCAMNSSVYGGSCLTLLPQFDPEDALAIVERDRVTVLAGVPTMYMALLAVQDKQRYDTSSLRLAASGGASLPVEVLHGVQQEYGFTMLEGYGLSETSPVATFNHPDRPTKPGSIGTPIHGVQVRVVDPAGTEVAPGEVGEISIRGENVMKGYWNDPDATAAAMHDGWFASGDLGRMDEDGYFYIVDRVKDMIVRNGYNVYPREVEELLYTHPDVAEVAVVGVPHEQHGEEIAAVVTCTPNAQVTEDELREWTRERIAAYKYPRIVTFGTIPKGPTGKMLKRSITISPQ